MRRLLLASAAFAFLGASSAIALNSNQVQINSTVAPVCSITADNTSVLTLPANGDESAGRNFTYTCNFTGTADVHFSSSNGGVEDVGNTDNPGPQIYDILYLGVSVGDSDVGATINDLATAVGPTTKAFTVQLQEPITIAGEYDDVLTLTITL